MTQTNIDYLFQITQPIPERTPAAARAGDDVGKFDNHLSLASTLSGDDAPKRANYSQRTDTARSDRDDRSWNTGSSKPSDQDNGSSSSSRTPLANDEQPACAANESNVRTEQPDGEDHDAEKSDDTTAAEVAGAGQTAVNDTKKTDLKTGPNTYSHGASAIAAVITKKVAAPEAGDPKAASNGEHQTTNAAPSPDAVTQQADEAARLAESAASAVVEIVETGEAVDELQATGSEGKPSKATKNDAPRAKAKQGARVSNGGAVYNDQPVNGDEIEDQSFVEVAKVNENVEASATPADAITTKDHLDADESSDDDSRSGSQNAARLSARNDAAATTNKVDTAQLSANISTPMEAGTNTLPKGKDNEQVTKPIAAKDDSVAAVFARMTRNNIGGSNDSTSGADDLPQVDPSRFIGRVVKAFQTAQDRGGSLHLRLSPPELGALRIELNVKDGVMSASLQTENSNARRLLLDHLPALRDRLAEQNIRVDRFDVDVRREGTGGQSDARGSQQQQFQHQPDQPAPRRTVQPQQRMREAAAPETIAVAPSVSDAGLNLIV